jgi:hypothetical protein
LTHICARRRAGGAGSIGIDNVSSSVGASSVYYTTLTAGRW